MHITDRIIITLNTLIDYYRRCGSAGLLHYTIRRLHCRIFRSSPQQKLVQIRGFTPDFNIRIGTSDIHVCDQVFSEQQYSYHSPNPLKTIVDIGANIGCSAIYFAKQHPEARIICIEANKDNYELLRANCTAFPNIECLHAALWTYEGRVQVVNMGLGEWAYRAQDISPTSDAHPQSPSISAITLEGIMRKYHLESIDLLKVDIEGAEREIFAPGPSILEKVNVFVVECHDRWAPGSVRSVINATRHFSYEWLQGESQFYCREGWLSTNLRDGTFRKIQE